VAKRFDFLIKIFLGLFCTAHLLGCSTPGSVSMNDVDVSIIELQKVVETVLPVGKRSQSENGREYFSEYFISKNGEFEESAQAAIRSFAHILILGDRKPYNIDVVVVVERRSSSGGYVRIKYDQGLARVISRRIQNALHKRRDGRNIIDDFRVF